MKKIALLLVVVMMFSIIVAVSESTSFQNGDSGEGVRDIQEALVALDYLSEKYITSNYDDLTELAIFAFQNDHSITPTGIADSDTQRAISDALKSILGDNSIMDNTNQDTPQIQEEMLDGSEGSSDAAEPFNTRIYGITNGGIIYEGYGCILSVASIDQKSCKILVKNNSIKDYSFCVHSLAINGVMTKCNPYLGRVNVSAGKKGFISFEFSDSLIEYKPDNPYNNLSMILWAYDNAKSYKDFETDVLTIIIDPTVQINSLSMGTDVIEDSGLSFSAISFTDNAITVAVFNNNSDYIDFDLTNTSVNGWALDTDKSVYDVALFPGCQAVFDVSFSDVKSEGGFSTVSEFEFSLKARRNGSYHSESTTRKIVFRK